jgi:hypothetical protein
MCRATLSASARGFRAGPTAFLAGCSTVWTSRPLPRDDLTSFFKFQIISENNLPLQTNNVLAFKYVLSVMINYLFKLGRNHGYL